MIRSYMLGTAAALAALASVNTIAADPLPTESHKVLTVDLAVKDPCRRVDVRCLDPVLPSLEN